MILSNRFSALIPLLFTLCSYAQVDPLVISCTINGAEYRDLFDYHAAYINLDDTIRLTYSHPDYKLSFDTVYLCINVEAEKQQESITYTSLDKIKFFMNGEVHIPLVFDDATEIVIPLSKYLTKKEQREEEEVNDPDEDDQGRHYIFGEKIRITTTRLHSPDKERSVESHDFIFRFFVDL